LASKKDKGDVKREEPYNPLDKKHLGESVADALLAREATTLPPPERVMGAGVYAIYYHGDYPLYARLAARNLAPNFEAPIYVGKAVPKGGRKGGELEPANTFALYDRLREHAESIDATKNLRLADFHCRYLVVDDIWIPLGETLLIQKFAPVWNRVLDGFGNHDPGGGRYQGQRPAWHVLHPGQAWAEKLQPHKRAQQEFEALVREYLEGVFPDEKKP
jgi:hypothetical protein